MKDIYHFFEEDKLTPFKEQLARNGIFESGENMEPLQEKYLKMAESLCHFVSNMNYYVIYAVVGPLEHFAIRIYPLG